MWLLVFFLVVLAAFALLRSRQKMQRLLSELRESVRVKRPYLVEERGGWLALGGLEALVEAVNGLIRESDELRAAGALRLEQLEKLFYHMKEAVLVLDDQKRILFSNPTSERLFGGDQDLAARRVEAVVHSSKFVHMLQRVREGAERESGEIEIIDERHTRCFEVSIAVLRPSKTEETRMTLILFHDITRLKELERIRKDFVANVSHELRTPLTVLKGFSEALVDPEARLSEAQRQTFLEKIHRHSVRLSALVEDLLILSRIESEGLQRRREMGRLSNVVRDFIASYPPEMNAAGVRLEADLAEEEPEFPFDPSQMQQILHNLVDNAFRYGETLTVVKVVTRAAADGRFELAVVDDGVGIPGRERERIFERFYRMEKGRHRDRGGTGLGLSIVRNAVLQHGGEVWAESEPGEGTRVRCLFPVNGSKDKSPNGDKSETDDPARKHHPVRDRILPG